MIYLCVSIIFQILWVQKVFAATATCYLAPDMLTLNWIGAGTYDKNALTSDFGICSQECHGLSFSHAGVWKNNYCFCINDVSSLTSSASDCPTVDGFLTTAAAPTSFLYVYELTPTQETFVSSSDVSLTPSLIYSDQTSPVVGFQYSYSDRKDKWEYSGDNAALKRKLPYNGVYEFYSKAVKPTGKNKLYGVNKEIRIHSEVTSLNVTCQPIAVVYILAYCTVQYSSGSGLTAEVLVDNVQYETPFKLPDKPWERVGSMTNAFENDFVTESIVGRHILASEFQYKGTVSFIEFNAAAASGSVKLALLKPSCGTASPYCFAKQVCDADVLCSGKLTCTDPFCSISRSCSGSCSDSRLLNTNDTTLSSAGYTIDKIEVVSFTVKGSQIHTLATPWEVDVGYRLMLYTSTINLIAVTKSQTAEFHYAAGDVSEGETVNPTSPTLRYFEHQISAVGQPIQMNKLWLMFNTTGTKVVKVKVTSVSGTATENTSPVDVGANINDTTLHKLDYALINEIRVFKLTAHSGEHLSYYWDFGDTNTATTTVETVNHTYTAKGTYTLFVNITNPIVHRNETFTIKAMERVKITVVNGMTDGYPNLAKAYSVDMATGSDFNCTFFGDDVTNETKSEGDTLTFSKTWTVENYYNIRIDCYNQLSSDFKEWRQPIFHNITDLQFKPRGVKVNDPNAKITFTWTAGALINFTFSLNNISIDLTIDEANKKGESVPVSQSVIGNYIGVLRAVNPVSDIILVANITYCEPVTGLKLEVDKVYVDKTNPMQFSIKVTTGSSMKFVIDFGDAKNETHELAPEVKYANDYSVSHSYVSTGTYNATVTSTNALETKVAWILVYSITALGTYDVVPNKLFLEKNEVFSFKLQRTSGEVASFAKLTIDWKDGQTQVINEADFSEDSTYTHSFSALGEYAVSITLTNPINSVPKTTTVTILTPISNFVCTNSPLHTWNGNPMTFKFSVEIGDRVIFGLQPGAGETFWSFTAGDVSTKFEKETTYTYNTVNSYTANMTACNELGCKIITRTIEIQYKVVDTDFTIKTNGFVEINTASTAEIVWTGTNFPTAMTAEFSFSTTPVPLLVSQMPYTETKTLTEEGRYILKTTLKNLASEASYNNEIGAFRRFSGFTMTITWGASRSSGFGTDKNRFPVKQKIYFKRSAGVGTVDSVEFFYIHLKDSTKIKHCNATVVDGEFFHIFDDIGEYNVSMILVNPIDKFVLSRTLILGGSMKDMRIILPSLTLPPKISGFIKVVWSAVDADACICVDFGNGTKNIYGATVNCTKCTPNYQYTGMKPVNNVLRVKVRYPTVGSYNIKVFIYNEFENSTTNHTLAISRMDCSPPIVHMVYDKYVLPETPQVGMRGEKNIVQGKVAEINCEVTKENYKRWSAERIDEEYFQVQNKVDLSPLETFNNTQLIIPPRFLPYGLYRLSFKVVMDTNKTIQTFVDFNVTHIKITSTPLIILLNKGALKMITVSDDDELCFNPTQYSIDLDLDKQNFDGWTWQWLCNEKSETPNPNKTVTPKDKDFTFPATRTGCFGDGPGLVNFKNPANPCFWTGNMESEKMYNFKLDAKSKDGRTGMVKIVVNVVKGIPPTINIQCLRSKLCKIKKDGDFPYGEVSFNPSDDLLVNASCKTPDSSVQCEDGNWLLELYDSSDPVKWKPLDKTTSSSFIKGITNMEMSVLNTFWEKYKTTERFRACYSAKAKGVEGRSCIQFYVNPLPSGIDCKVDKTDVKQTDSICCTCTYKPDMDYRIYVIRNNQSVTLGFNDTGYFCSIVPYSEKPILYNVRVTNKHGGYIDKFISQINIIKLDENEMNDVLKELESGDGSTLDMVNAKGDFKKMSELYLKYVSVITVSTQNLLMNSLTNATNQTLENYGATGYDVEVDPNKEVVHIEDLPPEKRQMIEDDRDKKSGLINKMTRHLNDMVPGDIKSLHLISGVVSSITESFDNLNREGQGQVSNKLVHLAVNLQNMQAEASRDDIYKISQSILSASFKSDTASNLQMNKGIKRDIQEAKENYLDYDTNLFSDSVSFLDKDINEASTGLTLETNKNFQGQVASGVKMNNDKTVNMVSKVIRDVTVIDDKPVEISSSHMQYMSMKTRPQALDNKVFKKGRSQVKMPKLCESFELKDCDNPNQIIGLEVLATPNNVRAFVQNAENGNSLPIPSNAETFTVNMFAGDKEGESSISKPKKGTFEMFLSKDPTFVVPAFKANEKETKIAPGREIPGTGSIFGGATCFKQKLVMHEFVLGGRDQSVHFQLKPDVAPSKTCAQYLVVARLSKPPALMNSPDGVEGNFSVWGMIPTHTDYCKKEATDQEPDPWTFFVSNSDFQKMKSEALADEPDYSKKKNTLYFGVRQLNKKELNAYAKKPPKIEYPYDDQINVTYTTRIYSAGCYYYDEKTSSWSTHGCTVGPLTVPKRTHCICNHLTSFAGGWVVAPNTIDFGYVFSNFDITKNVTLFVTEGVIIGVFILIFIWSRRQDLKDIEKLGVTPMADNDQNDMYLYELIVDTGIRNKAGTNSKVFFILSGENDETEARQLEDPKRKILKRGSVDRFLMAVPRSLGNLQYIRLWHDNSGKGKSASWYCNYFGVNDLQTKEKFHFLVNRWFAVEEDDGQIDRLIAVASVDELLQFGEVFTRKMKQDLTEGHLWLSVMTRPPESRFTRVERVACCLLLLFLTMLTTCMFYEKEGVTRKDSAVFTVGPFAITPKEVWVGFVSNIIGFLPLFIVIELFRRSNLKHGHANKLRQVVTDHFGGSIDNKCDSRSTATLTRNQEISSSRPNTPGYRAPDQVDLQVIDNKDSQQKSQQLQQQDGDQQPTEEKKVVRRRLLPWWIRIISWCFLVLVLLTAIFFTTLYGIQFGDEACKKWISAMFLSFFTSVLLTQPIKVIMVAMFFSLVCKKSDKLEDGEIVDEEDELMNELGERNGLNKDEEFLHEELYNDPVRPQRKIIQPPPKEEVERAREKRLKEMKMFDVLREILFYMIFFVTLLMVTYSLRDPNSFTLKTQLEHVFITARPKYDFNKIRKEEDFWNWGINVLVPALRAPMWYNNDPQLFQRGFISDRNNRLIGYAVMRQLRVKKDSCTVYSYIKHIVNQCYSQYTLTNEDKKNFSKKWKPPVKNRADEGFFYKNASQLNGLPYVGRITFYSGGGYVHEFKGNASMVHKEFLKLKENHWIDAQTRAIFIEFTTYNPNINLFAVNTLLLEMPGSGGIWPSYRVEPANLLGLYSSGVVAFEIFCQVLYGIFIIVMLVKEIRKLIKEKWKYFPSFWNMCEVFLIIGSFASAAAFAYVKIATAELTQTFVRYGGKVYIKFQKVAMWNEYLSYLVSFIVFVATLKFIRLLRFNRRMGMLGAVLSYSTRDMKQFFIIFAIMFSAFVMVFYSLFMDSLYRYHTFLHATEASMQIALGKFEFLELYQKEPIFGPIVFAFYVIFIIFVMLNMFVAILNEGFATVRADVELQSNDYELLDFLATKFIMWSGISTTKIGQKLIKTGVTDQVYKDVDSREMAAKVNAFPDKVDQLLNYVNRLIIGNNAKAAVFGGELGADNKSFSNVIFDKARNKGKPKIRGGDDQPTDEMEAGGEQNSNRPGTASSNIIPVKPQPEITPTDF